MLSSNNAGAGGVEGVDLELGGVDPELGGASGKGAGAAGPNSKEGGARGGHSRLEAAAIAHLKAHKDLIEAQKKAEEWKLQQAKDRAWERESLLWCEYILYFCIIIVLIGAPIALIITLQSMQATDSRILANTRQILKVLGDHGDTLGSVSSLQTAQDNTLLLVESRTEALQGRVLDIADSIRGLATQVDDVRRAQGVAASRHDALEEGLSGVASSVQGLAVQVDDIHRAEEGSAFTRHREAMTMLGLLLRPNMTGALGLDLDGLFGDIEATAKTVAELAAALAKVPDELLMQDQAIERIERTTERMPDTLLVQKLAIERVERTAEQLPGKLQEQAQVLEGIKHTTDQVSDELLVQKQATERIERTAEGIPDKLLGQSLALERIENKANDLMSVTRGVEAKTINLGSTTAKTLHLLRGVEGKVDNILAQQSQTNAPSQGA